LKPRSLLFGAALALGILPLANSIHMVRDWWGTRAGMTEREQYRQLRSPWCRPGFLNHVDRLRRAIPEDAAILCTPIGGDDELGRSRWFLFLADALYPRRVFVREPQYASGTLVTYPLWIEHHFEAIDTDESGLSMGGYVKRDRLEAVVGEGLKERGIDWELKYYMVQRTPFQNGILTHKGEVVDYMEGASAVSDDEAGASPEPRAEQPGGTGL
jgi:hypothetical protein